jgi:hypothetical protein
MRERSGKGKERIKESRKNKIKNKRDTARNKEGERGKTRKKIITRQRQQQERDGRRN